MRHRRRRHQTASSICADGIASESGYPEVEELCRQWVLRILIELGGIRGIVNETFVSEPQLLKFLGIDVHDDPCASIQQDVVGAVREQFMQTKGQPLALPEQSHLLKNIRWLKGQLGLGELDARILLLCVLERHHIHLARAMEMTGNFSNLRLYSVISTLLEVPIEQVSKALAAEGRLARTGLVRIDETGAFMFGTKLDLLHGLDEQLLVEQEKPFNIFSDDFVVVPEASLGADRFNHLQPNFDHLKNYLAHEIKQQTAGVNILIYGPPGTGKTEFARTLAKTIDAHLFEIAFAYRNGQRIEGARRLSAYALSQQILARRENSLIVFDEIEDIDAPIEDDEDIFLVNRGSRQNRKGWFNKLLETNAVPAIWISNRIRHIDPAHLRRFNYHLHIDVPPASVRTSMLAEQVKPLGVAEAWCRRMAINNRLEPAMIVRATSVVSAMREAGVTAAPEGLLEEVITASLSAQRIRHSTSPIPVESIQYRLDAINSGSDLSVIVNGLLAHPHARLCLYGPPGTGKSAFALHLAQQLGMPAHIRRASDILGAYVGETEQNIAKMFRRAKLDNAVLILDEADTFLFSRGSAHRHWEVSAVNEFLTQMEAFEGIFVATTNSIKALNAASMRRFDAKVEFRYLKKAQIALLLREACELLKIETADCDGVVADLRNLTPGDFATVVRQARFSPVKGLQDLIGRLDSEVRHKLDGDMRSIGFVTSVAA